MAGKAHRGGAVLAVSAGIGKGMEVDAADMAILHGADLHRHLHLMAGTARCLALSTGEDHAGGPTGLPGHKGGVNLGNAGLLGTKAAADAGLFHPDLTLGDIQGVGDDAAQVENDLGESRGLRL